MELVAPSGAVYQAGTLAGNPVAMSAGIETLKVLGEGDPYGWLQKRTEALTAGLSHLIGRSGVPAFVSRIGSLFTVFFSREEVSDYDSALRSDTKKYGKFFWSMLELGVYMPPSQFEACFVSLAHTEPDVERTLQATEKALASLAH